MRYQILRAFLTATNIRPTEAARIVDGGEDDAVYATSRDYLVSSMIEMLGLDQILSSRGLPVRLGHADVLDVGDGPLRAYDDAKPLLAAIIEDAAASFVLERAAPPAAAPPPPAAGDRVDVLERKVDGLADLLRVIVERLEPSAPRAVFDSDHRPEPGRVLAVSMTAPPPLSRPREIVLPFLPAIPSVGSAAASGFGSADLDNSSQQPRSKSMVPLSPASTMMERFDVGRGEWVPDRMPVVGDTLRRGTTSISHDETPR